MNLLEMTAVWWRLLRRRPVGLGIDVTSRCTLSCAGCYMKWSPYPADLPVSEWEKIILAFPPSERFFCAWTGGEPLLRADDVRALSRHFARNWLATNGTLPVPEIPRTTVFVSVDGPREIHDRLRGGWAELMRNVRPFCYVACTLRKENSDPEALRALAGFFRGRVRGIVFGFLTPPARGDPGALSREERIRATATISALRQEFGPFVMGARGQVPDSALTAWGGRCPVPDSLVAFDSSGTRKSPCTLGPEVDCSRCGCAVPAFLHRVRKLHAPTLVEVTGLFKDAQSGRSSAPRRQGRLRRCGRTSASWTTLTAGGAEEGQRESEGHVAPGSAASGARVQ